MEKRRVSMINEYVNSEHNLSVSTSTAMADHISITANTVRENVISPAIITEVQDLSKTVKLLKLQVKDDAFSFKAGQWVDMFIPGIETIGGFSMCSAPDLLTSSRIFHLAVKFSNHPPAYWVHSKCRVGDCVKVRAGGDFFYDSETPDTSKNLLLLAGGVGINPLYSILLHFVSMSSRDSRQAGNTKATLVYTARTRDEFLFKEELMRIDNTGPNVDIQLQCTQETDNLAPGVKAGRIGQGHIESCLGSLDQSLTAVYICGPSTFINDMETYCLQAGVPQHRIHYEKWW